MPGTSASAPLSGELVAFCDDDDYWLPTKLAEQVRLLEQYPDTSIVCAGITVHYGEESVRPARGRGASSRFPDLLRDRMTELHPSTFLMRRSDLAGGGFGLVDENVPGSYGEDYEFLLRASRQAPVRSVAKPLDRRALAQELVLPTLGHHRRRPDVVAGGVPGVRAGPARARPGCGARSPSPTPRWVSARKRSPGRWAPCARNPLEPRWALALGVAAKAVSADTVLAKLHARGKGI